MRRSTRSGVAIALLLLAGAVLLAFGVGRFPVAPADVLRVLGDALGVGSSAVPDNVRNVVLHIRGPRIVAALAVGAALALAGATFQGLFRNPLVSPDILGASAGAALGAVLGIFFALPLVGIQAAAFASGLLAVGAVVGVGSAVQAADRGDPVLVLLLTGLVLGALVGAGIGLVKVLADPYDQLPAMTFWLLGSLSGATARDLGPLLLPVLLGAGTLLALRHRLDALSLPDEEARALGLPTTTLRLVLIAAATQVTAASVAVAGIVGWVGLVVPHLARFLVGPSFPRLLPVAALIGGGFLLLIDTLARTMAAVEVPLGLLPPHGGSVRLYGRPLAAWSPRERARRMAYVPQAAPASFAYRVDELVMMGRSAHQGLFARPSAADHAAVAAAIKQLGLQGMADRPATAISGGERQLALIARALAQDARIVVLDEPTASLDFGNQGRVLRELRRLAAAGMAVLFTTHDPNQALRVADRVLLLRDGTVQASGLSAQVLGAAALQRLYGVPVDAVHAAPGRTAFLPALD